MFDDLNDPNPPVPDVKTLAEVTSRARRIRRRRELLIGASAAVLVIVAVIGVLQITDDETSTISDVTIETTMTTTTTTTTTTTGTTTTTTGTTAPPSSPAPTTAVLTPTTGSAVASTVPVPGVSPGASTTVAGTSEPPAVTTATTTSPTTSPTTVAASTTTPSTAPTAPSRPIVAIDGNGDAVIIDRRAGTSTILYDGPDPDDPPPSEGESFAVDAVAVTDNSSIAFVGTCCEPIPGTILRFANNSSTPDTAYGHAPAISPDGTKVATDVLGAVVVRDTALWWIASTPDDFLGSAAGNGFVWLDDRRFVILATLPDEVALQMIDIAPDATLQAGARWSASGVDGFEIGLAGSGPGVIYVRGLQPSTLTAFDATTLQRVPSADLTLPADPVSAWIENGERRWIDQDRQLHIDDAVVPGEYIWVR